MLTPFGSGKEAESLGMKRSVYNKAVSFSTSKQEMNFSIGCLECLLPGQTKKKIYFIENKMFGHKYLLVWITHFLQHSKDACILTNFKGLLCYRPLLLQIFEKKGTLLLKLAKDVIMSEVHKQSTAFCWKICWKILDPPLSKWPGLFYLLACISIK